MLKPNIGTQACHPFQRGRFPPWWGARKEPIGLNGAFLLLNGSFTDLNGPFHQNYFGVVS